MKLEEIKENEEKRDAVAAKIKELKKIEFDYKKDNQNIDDFYATWEAIIKKEGRVFCVCTGITLASLVGLGALYLFVPESLAQGVGMVACSMAAVSSTSFGIGSLASANKNFKIIEKGEKILKFRKEKCESSDKLAEIVIEDRKTLLKENMDLKKQLEEIKNRRETDVEDEKE